MTRFSSIPHSDADYRFEKREGYEYIVMVHYDGADEPHVVEAFGEPEHAETCAIAFEKETEGFVFILESKMLEGLAGLMSRETRRR
jgi:hypothetical protein